jgi:RHH-type proline utilization regulon transcriptional repressor/proline dehydrogenase/delta 1-pyrroline-5-carboxylate dehydrogenase
VLRGLGDDLAEGISRLGYRVRIYTPIGDLVAGMAYLVRRLLENSSNEGFLLRQRHQSLDELLRPPA